MKRSIFLLLLLLTGSLSAQVITGFGNSGDFNPSVSFGSDTAFATRYSISGSDQGSQLFGSVPSVFIGTPTTIFLTATQSSNISSVFQIELFDSSGNGVLYQGNWSSFPQNTVVTVPLEFLAQDSGNSSNFNGTVTSIGLLTSGLGNTLNLSLDTLSAIPEPAAWAGVLGVGALGVVGLRRRRRV